MRKTTALLLWVLIAAIFGAGAWHHKTCPSTPVDLVAQGYGGPITMNLTLSPQGAVQELRVLRHNETASYVHQLDQFIRQFTGRTGRDPLILGKDIDAISGATITSRAITDAVRSALASKIPAENQTHLPRAPLMIGLGLWGMAIAAFIMRQNTWRWAVMAGAFAYFGIMTHTMLSIIQVIQAGLGHIPSFHANPLWWLLLTLTFASALTVGRIYCGSLCPFAIVQEVLHLLIKHRHPATTDVSPWLDRKARAIKYMLLVLITATCAALGNAHAANIEPFITLFTGHGSKLALSLLCLTLVLAVFYFRFWCQYLCPVGALTSLAAVFSAVTIRPTSRCTACRQCAETCPTQAITVSSQGMPSIDKAECILCAKCLRTCPEKALTLGYPPHEKK